MKVFNFNVSGQDISSVVVSEEEWDEIIQMISESDPIKDRRTGEKISTEFIEALRIKKHIPMMSRGTKTSKFFDHCGVDPSVNLMSVIVRGHGMDVFTDYFGGSFPEMPQA